MASIASETQGIGTFFALRASPDKEEMRFQDRMLSLLRTAPSIFEEAPSLSSSATQVRAMEALSPFWLSGGGVVSRHEVSMLRVLRAFGSPEVSSAALSLMRVCRLRQAREMGMEWRSTESPRPEPKGPPLLEKYGWMKDVFGSLLQ